MGGAKFYKTNGKKASEMDDEFRDWSLSQPAVGGCLFCPDFRPEGTGEEVKIANTNHLASVHPELVGKKRKRRPRANPAAISRHTLTDEESDAVSEERRRRMFQLGIDVEQAQKIA